MKCGFCLVAEAKGRGFTTEPQRFTYTWQLPGGRKRFPGASYGKDWPEALAAIQQYHPRQTEIRRTG